MAFQSLDIGIRLGQGSRFSGRRRLFTGQRFANQPLDVPNGQPLLDDLGRQLFGIGCVDQRTRMAHGEFFIDHQRLDAGRQLQQPHQIGDMAARFADNFRQPGLAVAKILAQPRIGLCFLDHVEVLALDILDDRDLQRFLVVEVADDGRNLVQPGALRRTPAPFAGDNLEILAVRPDNNRLDHAALAHAAGQLVERVRIEMLSRLVGIGANIRNRDRAQPVNYGGRRPAVALGGFTGDDRLFALDLAEQAVQSPAQSGHALRRALALVVDGLVVGHQAATFRSGSRPINSRARSI